MYRPVSKFITLAAGALLAFAAASLAGADDVGAYLERLGLKRILAVHLEQKLSSASDDEREEIALRLASLYAELLESVTDTQQRELLERRSRDLIKQVPEAAADELRLALARAPFRAAERTAEQHRLRRADEASIAFATSSLESIVAELEQIRKRFDDMARTIERRRNRASGFDQSALNEQLERALAMRSDSTFLLAWSKYYQTYLTGRTEHAREAQYLFAELLNLESPEPRGVSMDLRSTEPVARSVLGMALCKSQIASTAAAMEWLDLLDLEDAFEPVRRQLPAWRLVVLLEHGEFQAVYEQLRADVEADVEVPAFWMRLAAVHGLEADRPTRAASALAQFAITQLASREELGEVLDLATRYGMDALGSEGFALLYVRGVLQYSEARDAHGAEHPATDAEIVRQFQAAQQTLEAAITEPDADQYRQAAGSCLKLIGWSRYFQGRFLSAREAFEQAASRLTGDDASDALWMAIVSLDKVVQAGASAAMQAELAGLIERFLDEFPSSEHAPKLVLKRAATAHLSRELIAELLEIPPNSEIYFQARSRAAEMLYLSFRDAGEDESGETGNEYLNVAVPLINLDDEMLIRPDDELWRMRVAVRCRRILEVSLRPQVARLAAARRALDTLTRLEEEFGIDLAAHANELDYRRIEFNLFEGNVNDAAALADKVYDRTEDDIWSQLASRALFRYGYERWTAAKDGGDAQPDNRRALELVVRYGLRVIEEYEDDATALQRTTVVSYYVAVGDALLATWRRSRMRSDAEQAMRLFDALLEVRGNNAHLLRSAAEVCEALGRVDRALELWRRLAAGISQSEPRWFEARWHVIDLLRQADPARAREVMDQHKQFHPEYGPPPWNDRLRDLDLQIPVDSATGGNGL